jgi:hypothetical protein
MNKDDDANENDSGEASSKNKLRLQVKTAHESHPRVIYVDWLQVNPTEDHVLKWAGNNPIQMLIWTLNMINQNDKSEIRAWAHDYHDATIRQFCQEEGVTRGDNRAIQSYRDVGNGWVSNPTYEYGKLVYLLLYTRFNEDPCYFIDAETQCMKENHWLIHDPKQSQGANNVNPKYIKANQKECTTLIIARIKIEIARQVLSKVKDMYGLTVSKVCVNGISPFSEKGTRAQKQSFHTCMVR